MVDDEPQARRVLRTALVAQGFEVNDAASGEEALEKLREDSPDAILLDLKMPGIGGLEACREIRASSEVPIIVVSGADYATCKETVKVAERLNLDIWECIPKPVDLVMLRHFLERLKASWNTVAVAA